MAPTDRTSRATQPGDVKPTGDDATPAANQTSGTNAEGTSGQPETDTTSQSVLTEAQAHPDRTFHDSLSGRPVTEDGHFTDVEGARDEGPVPAHRIVSDSWAEDRGDNEKSDVDVA